MQFLAASLLAVVIAGADEPDPLNVALADWEQAQREIRSLVVEFSQEMTDKVFNTTQKSDGIFRLMRTPKGEIHASFELNLEPSKGSKQERFTALLNDRTISVLDYKQKMELRLKFADKDLPGFLEDYFNPLAVLLDRKRAEENCNLEIKQDENYTYLSVSPKQPRRSGWFLQGRVVLMSKDSSSMPKGMPRQLWYAAVTREVTFEIKTWRMNGAADLKVEDFTSPKDRADWKVETADWPIWPFKCK